MKMWIELLIIIILYIGLLYYFTFLKKKYVIDNVNDVSYKKIERLKGIVRKNMKEQMEYFELTHGGSVLKGGFGNFLLTLGLFIVMGVILRFIVNVYFGMLFVVLYSLVVSLVFTRRSDVFVYSYIRTFVGFLFIGIVLLIFTYFDLSISFILLLAILYIIYLILNKWGGIKI